MPKRREHEQRKLQEHRLKFGEIIHSRGINSNSFFSIIARAKRGESILTITRELEQMSTDELKQLRGFVATELNRLRNLSKISPNAVDSKDITNLESLLRVVDSILHNV